MNDTGMIILTFISGFILGLFFFGGLWWTTKRAMFSKMPALVFDKPVCPPGNCDCRLLLSFTGSLGKGADLFAGVYYCQDHYYADYTGKG